MEGKGAAATQEGAEIYDDGEIGVEEARAQMKVNQEKEEAKQELEDLRESDDDEAGYGEGA